ncbi:glycoside hydrolase family 172 protein [uncultured Pseudoteredinibacter sp.]|uniref:glycoside hydrolase family 172 protein n=1 Tax=uncultured Pseudoteredinibacter sp. TaxID=1641701 RepID=UPI0026065D66|nr:glycoside hydrolase family 172 protein [uncultured Pseudoteredinibacter sp.]
MTKNKIVFPKPLVALGAKVLYRSTLLCACFFSPASIADDSHKLLSEPYHLDSPLQSRTISFENPTGAKGEGGKASSPLGQGRKGSPARLLAPGETVELANIQGSGTIRHIWATTFPVPAFLRGAVIRGYWDGQEHPSIEAPLGDFFGFAHGKATSFQSAVHSVGPKAGMNIWLPMPFTKAARFTITNELPQSMPFFYQIDYTLGDHHGPKVGRLHVNFQRQNPTTKTKDFSLLPKRTGKGRFIGTVIGVRPSDTNWWGEGEMKAYIDGDDKFPTLNGSGAEDYVGLSWGLQDSAFLYNGASYREKSDDGDTGRVSMYRWHLRDPIYWQEEARITIQQIGHNGDTPTTLEEYLSDLYEREDDWSAASFWYEAIPSAPLPQIPALKSRIADLPAAEEAAH